MKARQGAGRAAARGLKWFLTVLCLVAGLSGCSFGQFTTAETSGVLVGGTVAAATGNALLGIGSGLVTSWGVRTGFEHYRATQQAAVQEVIAGTAGATDLGEASSWRLNELHGTLEVTRTFGLWIPCKEVVFTVTRARRRANHVGTVCRAGDRWEWAVAEPRAKPWIEETRPTAAGLPEWE